MTTLHLTIAALLVALASLAAAPAPSQAGFEMTLGGQTTQVCTWTSAGAALYRAAQEPQGVPAGATVRKLAPEHPFTLECQAAREARALERAQKRARAARARAAAAQTAE